MRKIELIFAALRVPLDYLMILLAALTAYWLRFTSLAEELPIIYQIPFKAYFLIAAVVAFVWLGIFALAGLYAIEGRRTGREIGKIILACSAGIMLIIFVIFLKREFFSSRFIILASWVLAIIFVGLGRIIIHRIQKLAFEKGIGRRRVVVIGQDGTAKNIVRALKEPSSGYQVVDWVKEPTMITEEWRGKFANSVKIDEIIQADPTLSREARIGLVDFCDQHHITFKYAPDRFGALATNLDVETLAGMPIIEIKRTALDGWGRIVKRAVDILGAGLGLVLFSPFFTPLAIMIKSDSNGPVFVRLERIGERGERFFLYKFRSMVKDAGQMKRDLVKFNERNDGPLFKMKNDPRITRVGRWLRRTSLDELPQLVNVILGQMSLIGPRPHEPGEVAEYQKHHRKLLTIKPGITGFSQISGRSDLVFEEEVRLDSYYIENWSLGLDLQILLRTPWMVLFHKSAC